MLTRDVIGIVMSCALSCAAPTAARAQEIAIVGGTVLDGNGGPPLREAAIVVSASRIRAVGPKASVPIPNGAAVIDATGRFMERAPGVGFAADDRLPCSRRATLTSIGTSRCWIALSGR
jgi:hypothetical protein